MNIDKKLQEFFVKLEETIDEQFPKHKCKERSGALVLFAEANVLCRQALKQQQADHKKELEVADERWKSNEKYRERYMDGYVEEKLSWEKDLIEKIEKIIEEERYSGAPIALNKLIKIIKEG